MSATPHTLSRNVPLRGQAVLLAIAVLFSSGAIIVSAQENPDQPGSASAQTPEEGIRLNFKDAPLTDVLNYLSQAAGFVILQDGDLSGKVTVVSHQPVSPDEAIDLLNAILIDQGYVAINNGRILKIVDRDEAHKFDLPVRSGSNPTLIPKSDVMVNQIIPVRYGDAAQLLENLRPLLSENAKLTANESSNALIMTDTQVNIRRIVEIIQALDTSTIGVATIRVFPLQYADATELAEVVQELFQEPDADPRARGGRGGRFRFGGPGGDGGGGDNDDGRQESTKVTAVADERSNALVVGAPEELIPTIEQLVTEMDVNISDVTEVRLFRLENADAVETAELLTDLFDDMNDSDSSDGAAVRRFFARRGGGGPGGGRGNVAQDQSDRALKQSKVVAVGDRRTNTLLVSAARDAMLDITELVVRLDSGSDKKQRVYVYPLEHADVDNVAGVLRSMFDEDQVGTTTRPGANRLTERSESGASEDISTSFGGGVRSGGGTGTGRR